MGKGIDSDDEHDGHKRTRFPCLATARFVVAGVVSVLTVVVVVMVTIVALRREKVVFSIGHYIKADSPWCVSSYYESMAPAVPTTNSKLNTGTATSAGSINSVYIWVSLTADNPSGRTEITGENVTISVLDLPYSSFQGLKEIVTSELLEERFTLQPQTSHTLGKWILVNNTRVMSYLAYTYGDCTSFQAMLQLTATIVTTKVKQPKSQIYYCWPVTVALYDPSPGYSHLASCRPEKEMGSPVSFSLPPPAPAPAPAPTADAR